MLACFHFFVYRPILPTADSRKFTVLKTLPIPVKAVNCDSFKKTCKMFFLAEVFLYCV